MRKLTVENFGTEAQGIRLYGDPHKQPEPPSVRIAFPGGEVAVERTTVGDYWVHVRVNTEQYEWRAGDEQIGRLVDARLDIHGKPTSLADVGDFADPMLYHLAVRVGRADT